MKIFTVWHTKTVNGTEQRFSHDKDRIEADTWEEAEHILFERYRGDPSYSIRGELKKEIPHSTILDQQN